MKITIAGWAGTGKSTTAGMLARELGYDHYSGGGIFRSYAQEQELSLNELERQAETDPQFDTKLDEHQVELGKTKDDFVMESRLGWYFIPDSVKIKLDCDDAVRLERIATREEKDIETVERQTKEREESIRLRYKDLYGIENFMDDDNFDLVINTAASDPVQVLDTIISYLDSVVEKGESQ